jgi:hypothetical protein
MPVCSILRRRASLILDASNPTCKAAWGHNQMVQCSNSWIVLPKALKLILAKLVQIYLLPSNTINLLIPTMHATCFGCPWTSAGFRVHDLKPK